MLLFRQVFEDASFKRVGIGVGVGVNVDVDVDKGVFPNTPWHLCLVRAQV